MAFQQTVALQQAFGVIGDIGVDGPKRVTSWITKGSAITIGKAFTLDASDGKVAPGGTGVFVGILANSKEYSSAGTTGNPLAPTLDLAAGTVGAFLTMGTIVIAVGQAAAIGDSLYFTNATGVISIGTASTGQTQIPNAKVAGYANAAAGLIYVTLTN